MDSLRIVVDWCPDDLIDGTEKFNMRARYEARGAVLASSDDMVQLLYVALPWLTIIMFIVIKPHYNS